MIPGRVKERVGTERDVPIEFGKVKLLATLNQPETAIGIVLFAHGSGSSRLSPHNRYAAEVLQSHGIATLLLDLLTTDEEVIDRRTSQLSSNIRLLAKRLVGATSWTMRQPDLRGLDVGYFGASTGTAAALMASAARLTREISAVVSRGGRPDLAGESLGSVQAPTLLIVGGNDGPMIELNQQALAELRCREKRLVIIPGATHLFEEPGALEELAQVTAEWFIAHFFRARQAQPGQVTRH